MPEADNALRKIVDYVGFHRLAKGDRLPSERELAEKFGMTRNVIREALAMLDTLRVIERRPSAGVFLRSDLDDASVDALVVRSQLGLPLTETEHAEILEARRLLEREAARLACARRTEDDLCRLKQLTAAESRLLETGDDLSPVDVAFHLGIIEAAHNAALLRILKPFYMISDVERRAYFGCRGNAVQTVADHGGIVEAIAGRDADRAIQLIERHVTSAMSFFRRTGALACTLRDCTLQEECPCPVRPPSC